MSLNYTKTISVLNSSADYIEKLQAENQFISHNRLNQDIDFNINAKELKLLTDVEEEDLLNSLGLNEKEFAGASVEWLESNPVTIESVSNVQSNNNVPKLCSVQDNPIKVKRPGNAFIRFSTERRKKISSNYPNYDNRQVSKILGTLWRKMSPEEKKPYTDQFAEEICMLRTVHPEWNYAASRAKSFKLDDESVKDVVIEERLRPRNSSSGYRDFLNSQKEEKVCRKKKKATKNVGENVLWVNCDICKKWRKMSSEINCKSLPLMWVCSMNPDKLFNNCEIAEEAE